jgi:hypothetical protein
MRIVGSVTVRARTEDAAIEKAGDMATDGKFGTVNWQISDSVVDDWYEEDVEFDIEEAEEV